MQVVSDVAVLIILLALLASLPSLASPSWRVPLRKFSRVSLTATSVIYDIVLILITLFEPTSSGSTINIMSVIALFGTLTVYFDTIFLPVGKNLSRLDDFMIFMNTLLTVHAAEFGVILSWNSSKWLLNYRDPVFWRDAGRLMKLWIYVFWIGYAIVLFILLHGVVSFVAFQISSKQRRAKDAALETSSDVAAPSSAAGGVD
jgi:hypothetical protein